MYPNLLGLDGLMSGTGGYAPPDRSYTPTGIPQSMRSGSGMYLDQLSKARKNQANVPNPKRKPLASPLPRPGNFGLAVALALIVNSMQKGAGGAGLQGFMQGSAMGGQQIDQQNELEYQNQFDEANRQRAMYGTEAEMAGMQYQGALQSENTDKAHANRLLEMDVSEKGQLMREFLNPQKPYPSVAAFDAAAGVMVDKGLIKPERIAEIRKGVEEEINRNAMIGQLSKEQEGHRAAMYGGKTPQARKIAAETWISNRKKIQEANPAYGEDPVGDQYAKSVIESAETETIDEQLGKQKLKEAIERNDPKGLTQAIKRAEARIKGVQAEFAKQLTVEQLATSKSRRENDAKETAAKVKELNAKVSLIRSGKDPSTGKPITDTASIGLRAKYEDEIGQLEIKRAQAVKDAEYYEGLAAEAKSPDYKKKEGENAIRTQQEAGRQARYQNSMVSMYDEAILAARARLGALGEQISQSKAQAGTKTSGGNKILSIKPGK